MESMDKLILCENLKISQKKYNITDKEINKYWLICPFIEGCQKKDKPNSCLVFKQAVRNILEKKLNSVLLTSLLIENKK